MCNTVLFLNHDPNAAHMVVTCQPHGRYNLKHTLFTVLLILVWLKFTNVQKELKLATEAMNLFEMFFYWGHTAKEQKSQFMIIYSQINFKQPKDSLPAS